MKRTILDITLISALVFAALVPGSTSAQDLSQIDQIVGNHATIIQAGNANSAKLEQQAILGRQAGNLAIITQDGSGNLAESKQKGGDNSASIEQQGNNNSAQLGQFGFGLKTDVTQNGNGLGVTVNQFGFGGAPVTIKQY